VYSVVKMELAIRRAGYDMPRDEMCDASTKELGLGRTRRRQRDVRMSNNAAI